MVDKWHISDVFIFHTQRQILIYLFCNSSLFAKVAAGDNVESPMPLTCYNQQIHNINHLETTVQTKDHALGDSNSITIQPRHTKVEGAFLLNVIIGEHPSVLELLSVRGLPNFQPF
jgi:hypothetical protein